MDFQWPFKKKAVVPSIDTLVTDRYKDDLSVGLTPLGVQKADEFAGRGPAYTVLSCLRDHHPVTVTLNELSREVHMDSRKVRDICKAFKKSDYIKVRKS